MVCNKTTQNKTLDPDDCADPEDIKYLLDKIYFTMYVVEDNVEFNDVGKDPFYTNDKFHS